MHVCILSCSSCPTLCDTMDCGRPGSSVHGFPGKNTGVGCHFLLQNKCLAFCNGYNLFNFFLNFILFFNFTILYWICHISKWIRHRYTCVPHPEPSSLLPPHTIPLGRPSAPAPSIQYCASNLERQLVSYMILYMFQCHSPKSSHTLPLPQSPKDCSIHQCLFCCLVYRVIVTIFLNSIYMR